LFFFFFQAEDGIRDGHVTGVQTCALPILVREGRRWPEPEYRFKHALIQETAYRTLLSDRRAGLHRRAAVWLEARYAENLDEAFRSEERRVGKECESWGGPVD